MGQLGAGSLFCQALRGVACAVEARAPSECIEFSAWCTGAPIIATLHVNDTRRVVSVSETLHQPVLGPRQ